MSEVVSKPDEAKVDDVKDEEVVEKTFMDMIKSLVDSDKKDVPKNVKKMFSKLLSVEEEHLKKIEVFVCRILADKKIAIDDVPPMILLWQELYVLYDKMSLKTPTEDICLVFKKLIGLLIERELSRNKELNEEEINSLLLSLNTLLDMCVDMVELKDTQRKLRSMFSYFVCGSSKDVKEVKEETKEEVKEETKEEPKAEAKEETKVESLFEEVKEEPKAEAK